MEINLKDISVGQLIQALQMFDQDKDVRITTDNGNRQHWRIDIKDTDDGHTPTLKVVVINGAL